MGKWQIALTALQQLPTIISFVETLLPQSGKSADKKQAATAEMTKYEGALALDQRVKDAKSKLIDAQVEYVNAMEAAQAQAQLLGIPIGPVQGLVPPLAPAGLPGGMVGAGATAASVASVQETAPPATQPRPAMTATTTPGV